MSDRGRRPGPCPDRGTLGIFNRVMIGPFSTSCLLNAVRSVG
jgi:hypothetical protein